MHRLLFFVPLLAALLTTALPTTAQPRGEWEVLGEQRTRPGLESLTIDIGRRAGRFDAVKIAVSGGNVLLLGVEITFGNGDEQKVRVRVPVTSGNETSPIDLEGRRGRFIRSVEVRYGSLGFLGRPTVSVLGRAADRGRDDRFSDLGRRWNKVSTERVSRERERDVVQMSRDDGRLDAILLRVKRSPVRISRVRVVFGNGRRQDFDVPRIIRPGDQTEVLELRGRRGRFIDRIVLVYRDAGGPRRARVEVWARAYEREGFSDLGRRWNKVSTERVSRERERDIVQMSRDDGRLDAILLRVKRSPVRISRVRVVFGNGRRQDFDVPRIIRPGDQTEVLELRGRRGRFIDRIVLVYRDAGGPRRARVEVWARAYEREGFSDLGPNWTRFSIERAEADREREIIPLSRRDGRFDAILLRVMRSPVRMRRVRVVFGNGKRQDFDVPNVLRGGDEAGPLELRGRRGRFIKRIVLVYRDAGGKRRARIEVWGRKAGR